MGCNCLFLDYNIQVGKLIRVVLYHMKFSQATSTGKANRAKLKIMLRNVSAQIQRDMYVRKQQHKQACRLQSSRNVKKVCLRGGHYKKRYPPCLITIFQVLIYKIVLKLYEKTKYTKCSICSGPEISFCHFFQYYLDVLYQVELKSNLIQIYPGMPRNS